MSDERTSLFTESRPGPSYVYPGRFPRTDHRKKIKQFQCWICITFVVILITALIIVIAYTITKDGEPELKTNDNSKSDSTDLQYTVLNGTEILNLFMIADWPMIDEPIEPWNLPEVTDEQAKDAIYAGTKALGDKELLEENTASPSLNTPSYRHQRAVSTTPEARKLAKRGYVENCATLEIFKNHTNKKPHRRWNIGRGKPIYFGGVSSAASTATNLNCDFNAKYRRSNGTCNNKNHPNTFGVAMLPFRRALNPDYSDGISAPRKTSINESLPSARLISIGVHRPSYESDPNFTVMLAVFGQFLDHDITATALNQAQDGKPIDCCVDGDIQPKHPECFPVFSGPGDPNFDKFNISCMNFIRSAPAPTGYFGPRQQLNQATAFIDGSVVYGTLDDRVQQLRSNNYGLLRMYNTPDNRTLLPVSTDPNDGCNESEMNSKGKYCFESGDTRANENLHLTSMHLIWARHHNYLADSLRALNADWDDEQIFQEARRILTAQLQHITYNEFLPIILGDEYCKKVGITTNHNSPIQDTYNPEIDPSIANIFAACAFRFAHTLLPGLMKVSNDPNTTESIELHRMLFNPYSLWRTGGLDSAIGSAISTLLAKSDQYFSTELTEKLFQNTDEKKPIASTRKTVGLDLVSLNIQRGRDHGLPAYPEWRRHCKLPAVDTWEQMSHAVDSDSLENMKSIYKNVNDVDVYTGALSEPPMVGAIIGPLLSCLLTDQFLRIKQGDSFWFERTYGPQSFTKEQLQQIYNTTLASIICRNSDAVSVSQPFVMKKVGVNNEMMACQRLDSFDFNPWNEKIDSTSVKKFIKFVTQKMNVLTIKNTDASSSNVKL